MRRSLLSCFMGSPLVVLAALMALMPVPGRADEPGRVVLTTRIEGKPVSGAARLDLRLEDRGRIEAAVPGPDDENRSWMRWYLVSPDPSGRDFVETPLPRLDDRLTAGLREIRLAAGDDGPGTYRLRVEARTVSGTRLSSPGGKNAFCLTFRRADDYIGFLESYFHVPYKFGSSQEEVREHLYADCADFVVGGYQMMGGANLGDMGTATMMAQWRWFFEPIAMDASIGPEGSVRRPDGGEIVFGEKGARPGDIVLFKGHTGVLTGDAGRKGRLDARDPVIHHLVAPPRIDRLANVWHGPFHVIRWRDFTSWQKRLKQLGLYRGPVDGVYNADLEKAVRRFQSASGLRPDGIPGPNTEKRLVKNGDSRG